MCFCVLFGVPIFICPEFSSMPLGTKIFGTSALRCDGLITFCLRNMTEENIGDTHAYGVLFKLK
jgi:hypothetical protein